eukprot:g49.t1
MYMEDKYLVYDTSKIAWRYITSWFAIDLISSIPIGFVLDMVERGHSKDSSGAYQGQQLAAIFATFRLLRIVRLIKLLRFFKFLHILNSWGDTDAIGIRLYRLLKSTFIVLFVIHLLGCIWFFIATTSCNLEDGMASQSVDIMCRNSWLAESGMLSVKDMGVLYLWSIYWAATTISTVGYGEIVPVSPIETLVSIVGMMAGGITVAYITGTLMGLVSDMEKDGTLIREKISAVSMWMKSRQLSHDLQERIRKHYEYCWQKHTIYDESKILQELPDFIKREVVFEISQDIIRSVEFISEGDNDLLMKMAMKLVPTAAAPDQKIILESAHGTEMYFISKGIVVSKLIQQNVFIESIAQGSYFGEKALMSENRINDTTCMAKTYLEMYALPQKDFNTVVRNFPQVKTAIENKILEREKLKQEAVQRTSVRRMKGIFALDDEDSSTISRTVLTSPNGPRRESEIKKLAGNMTELFYKGLTIATDDQFPLGEIPRIDPLLFANTLRDLHESISNFQIVNSASGQEEDDDDQCVFKLSSALLNERASPEIQPFKQGLVALVQGLLENNQAIIHEEFNKSKGVDEAFTASIYQMEVDRIRFLLAAYLRARLAKIEASASLIDSSDELRSRLGPKEKRYLDQYLSIYERHLDNSVLNSLSKKIQNLAEIPIPTPDLNKHVFCKVLKTIGEVRVERTDEPITLEEGQIYLMRYESIKKFLRDGDVELL